MFTVLKDHNKILVTGCQRSGTTIAAKMIASSFNLNHIDEIIYGAHDHNKVIAIFNESENVVVQGPAISHMCHCMPDDVYVVWMNRDIEDIRRSMKRINWLGEYEQLELDKYNGQATDRIEILKQEYYHLVQKNRIANTSVIEYVDLRTHQLWIDDEHRTTFGEKQTE